MNKFNKSLLYGLLFITCSACAENTELNYPNKLNDLTFPNARLILGNADTSFDFSAAAILLKILKGETPSFSAFLGTWETENTPDSTGIYVGYELEIYRPLLNNQIVSAILRTTSGHTNPLANLVVKILAEEGGWVFVDLKFIDGIVKSNLIYTGGINVDGNATLIINSENINKLYLTVRWKVPLLNWEQNLELTLYRVSGL